MPTYQDKDGRWRWRARIKNPFTGEVKRISGSAPGSMNTRKAAAEDERGATERYRRNPQERLEGVPTLAAFIKDTYLPWTVLTGKERSTMAAQSTHINRHILPALGHLRLDSITKKVVESWVASLMSQPQLPRGRASTQPLAKRQTRTVQHIRATLHTVLVRAVEEGVLLGVPPFPRLPKIARRHPNFLEFHEERALYAVTKGAELERALFLVAVRCGLRASEQMGLEWTDINFERKTLTVKRALVLGEVKPPKNGRERTLDIDEETLEALQAIRQDRSPLVFCRPLTCAPMTYDLLKATFRRARARAGIKRHFRWHDLRHTFGSHLAIAGNELQVIRDLMGHQSIKTTEIYAHLLRKNGQEALKKVGEARAKEGA